MGGNKGEGEGPSKVSNRSIIVPEAVSISRLSTVLDKWPVLCNVSASIEIGNMV